MLQTLDQAHKQRHLRDIVFPSKIPQSGPAAEATDAEVAQKDNVDTAIPITSKSDSCCRCSFEANLALLMLGFIEERGAVKPEQAVVRHNSRRAKAVAALFIMVMENGMFAKFFLKI